MIRPDANLKPYYIFTGILSFLMLVTAVAGLIYPATYGDFIRPQRVAESQGQDVITLFVALPLLALGLLWARRGDLRGPLVWVGTLGYVLYVYLIYAYGGLYNIFFPGYVAIVGLCIFSIIGLLNSLTGERILSLIDGAMPRRFIAGYLLGTVLLLTVLWGIAIATAITTKRPDEGTIIYVTDLTFVLPVFALAGIWLLQRKAWGYLLTGVVLVKAVTLGLSIAAGQFIAYVQDVGGDLFLAIFFVLFTLIGALALWLYLRYFQRKIMPSIVASASHFLFTIHNS